MTTSDKIHFLTVEEVLEIHRSQFFTLGDEPPEHQKGVLRGCLAMPSTKIGGQYSHQDLFEMAAAYLFHLSSNRPFQKGNLKVAALASLYFLFLHDIEVSVDPQAFSVLIKNVSHGKASKRQVADYLRQNAEVR